MLGGVEARILADDGEVLPWDGQHVGEMDVRGPWVPAAITTAPDPAKFRDGWLRTGDMGGSTDTAMSPHRPREGRDQVKGEWISTLELESALLSHPAVSEAAVIAAPDERWGERPLACVTPAPGQSVSPEELRVHLSGRVARWWLPERWAFIEQVPRTSVGKHDKKLLRAHYAGGALDVVVSGGPGPSRAGQRPGWGACARHRTGQRGRRPRTSPDQGAKPCQKP